MFNRKRNKTMKKKFKPFIFLTLLYFCFAIFPFHSQDFAISNQLNLGTMLPNWVYVLGGNVLCQPLKTSQGFCVVSEGKVLTSFSEEGSIIWQRAFPQGLQPYISQGFGEMIFAVTRKTQFQMINCTGTTLFQTETDFPITQKIIQGKDGRLFAAGSDCIACYDLKGNFRWKTPIHKRNTDLDLVELNDGSLLVFLEKTQDDKTIGLRVNPFGKIIEQIVFAAKVIQAAEGTEGVLMTFADGSAGLCCVENGTAVSKWALKQEKISGSSQSSNKIYITQAGLPEGKCFILSGSPSTVNVVNTFDGSIISSFESRLDSGKIIYSGYTSLGYVFIDNLNAMCTTQNGDLIWDAKFSKKKPFSYVLPSDTGYLVCCGTDWVIQSYRVKQFLGKAEPSSKPEQPASYSDFYSEILYPSNNVTGRLISQETFQNMKEYYSPLRESDSTVQNQEEFYLSALETEFQAMTDELKDDNIALHQYSTEETYFRHNIPYVRQLIEHSSLTGFSLFQKKYAYVLKNFSDKSLLLATIIACKETAFDPFNDMMDALDFIVQTRYSVTDEVLLKACCDAVYEICRYMGRPAFFSQGKKIISSMLYPKYSPQIRNYARQTMGKISKLSL